MSETTPKNHEALQAAYRQVGEFLFHFSLLEQEIDDGIGKLLGIGAGAVDIVTANMDFVRKVYVLRSAERFMAAMPEEARKKKTEGHIWRHLGLERQAKNRGALLLL